MKIYALRDLHLGKSNRLLENYDPTFKDHIDSIFTQWTKTVTNNDIVLIPGDVMDGSSDVAFLDSHFSELLMLKGTIIFSRGNTDYWLNGGNASRFLSRGVWEEYSKIKARIHPNTEILAALDNPIVGKDYAFVGCIGSEFDDEDDFSDYGEWNSSPNPTVYSPVINNPTPSTTTALAVISPQPTLSSQKILDTVVLDTASNNNNNNIKPKFDSESDDFGSDDYPVIF